MNESLEIAEAKVEEAKHKEREADELERLVVDVERNIHRLCDQLVVNGRQRGDVQRKTAPNQKQHRRKQPSCITT